MKLFFSLLISFVISLHVAAQNKTKQLEVHVANTVFFDATSGSYVETVLSINPHSLVFMKQADSLYRANLKVTIIFKNDSNEIIHFDKYQLNTIGYKTYTELANTNTALVDLRRNLLPNGKYIIETSIENENRKTELTDSSIAINFTSSKFSTSGIVLLDTFYENATTNKFQKGNMNLIPMVMNYYPSSKNTLSFYTEVYPSQAAKKESKYILQYAISKKESGKIIDGFSNSDILENAEIIPSLTTIDISKLATGNYHLNIQILNRDNEVYTSNTISFQRFKTLTHKFNDKKDTSYFSNEIDLNKVFVRVFKKEEMKTRLHSLLPIAASNEANYIKNLVSENNEEHMKRFYYNFWANRNSNSPIAAFNEYEEQLKIVNSNFGTSIQYGFETDRGRVYLEYGAPNTIEHSAEGGTLTPNDVWNGYQLRAHTSYEVWDYYALDDQKNVQFVFAPRDRSSNDYEIVYTNKIGEKNNLWNTGTNTQSSMPVGPGANSMFGNTLDRDMNSPTNNSNSNGGGINTIMNNPK